MRLVDRADAKVPAILANRVFGYVLNYVRASDRVVGAEPLEMGQALLPLSKRRKSRLQFLGW